MKKKLIPEDNKIYINLKLCEISSTTLYGSQPTFVPYWFQNLLDSEITKFCKKYTIKEDDAYPLLFNLDNMKQSVSHIHKLFSDAGYIVETYDITPFPSFGLIFDNTDPKIVELKLKADI